MHLAAFITAGPGRPGDWRYPGSVPGWLSARYYQDIARTLEDARFDLAFFADILSVPDRRQHRYSITERRTGIDADRPTACSFLDGRQASSKTAPHGGAAPNRSRTTHSNKNGSQSRARPVAADSQSSRHWRFNISLHARNSSQPPNWSTARNSLPKSQQRHTRPPLLQPHDACTCISPPHRGPTQADSLLFSGKSIGDRTLLSPLPHSLPYRD